MEQNSKIQAITKERMQLTRTVTGTIEDVVYNLSLTNGFTTATASLTVQWP